MATLSIRMAHSTSISGGIKSRIWHCLPSFVLFFPSLAHNQINQISSRFISFDLMLFFIFSVSFDCRTKFGFEFGRNGGCSPNFNAVISGFIAVLLANFVTCHKEQCPVFLLLLLLLLLLFVLDFNRSNSLPKLAAIGAGYEVEAPSTEWAFVMDAKNKTKQNKQTNKQTKQIKVQNKFFFFLNVALKWIWIGQMGPESLRQWREAPDACVISLAVGASI